MHILVAEDDPVASRVLLRMLEAETRDIVVSAADGEEAWEILSDPECTINVCFVDLLMPRMNGMELISKMRRSPNHDKTPVVLYTSVQDRRIVEKAAGLHIAGYLIKPAQQERLVSILAKIRETLAASAPASATDDLPVELREVDPTRPGSGGGSFAPAAKAGRVPLLEEAAVVCKRLGVDALIHTMLLRFTVAGLREWADELRKDTTPGDAQEAITHVEDLMDVCLNIGVTGAIPDLEQVKACLLMTDPLTHRASVNTKFLDNLEETMRRILDRIGDEAVDSTGAKMLMLPIRRLRAGQVTVTPILARSGLTLVAPETILTPAIVQRLRGFMENKDVKEPVFVRPSIDELAAKYN